MHLRPRHYILIALVLALGAYNIFLRTSRARRAPQPVAASRLAPPSGPRPESAAWTAFDQAAAQRDAPDAQFSSALAAFRKQTTGTAGDPDLSGCSTWLEFYRQGILHPSRDHSWHDRSAEHLDSCTKFHRDLAS